MTDLSHYISPKIEDALFNHVVNDVAFLYTTTDKEVIARAILARLPTRPPQAWLQYLDNIA